jgi:BirA family biotin operon repressor/biotin-[acetyl-CoA-carboxylase] ligase
MNIKSFNKLPIGEIRYFHTIGSTNDAALAWATEDAPDLSIVIADEQTSGRGRLNRKWFTPKGSALAFSVILHPSNITHLSRTVGLAALSISDACSRLGLVPQIKWPNDILLNGKKTAGILIETVWAGDKATALVIGMGINIQKESIPPAEGLGFPATSIESELGHPIERESFLKDVLSSLVSRLPQIETDDFLAAWENQLAYKHQWIQVISGTNEPTRGELLGLESDGGLRLRGENGKELTIRYGDVSLRPTA